MLSNFDGPNAFRQIQHVPGPDFRSVRKSLISFFKIIWVSTRDFGTYCIARGFTAFIHRVRIQMRAQNQNLDL